MTLLILASGSPRRAEMMAKITEDFEIAVPDINESALENEKPESMVERLAVEKAKIVFNACSGEFSVLAADTIVVHDRILGKPADEKEAEDMLRELADDSHMVITGVSIIDSKSKSVTSFIEKTEVTFGPINNLEIAEYVAGGEPMDKAGAYGIQGEGGRFIKGINGCFYNVMGFPLNRIYSELKRLNII